MALINKINLNDPFMALLKKVNSLGAKGMSPEELASSRNKLERAATLATPSNGLVVTPFTVEDIACEWLIPEMAHNPSMVILYSHGGGYTAGGLSYARILASKLALVTGLSVLSYEYRLAPEHPYPAAFEDGLKVWDYLMYQGFGASQVILAGDSAGGNLTLCLTQHLIEKGRKLPKGLILFSPWTDMTAQADSYQEYATKDPILTVDYIKDVRDAYLGKEVDLADPKFSPLFGEFAGFPPTLIQVGRNEILLDDSIRLEKKLKKAGVKPVIEIYKDGWHVFQQMPLPQAGKAMKAVGYFVSELIYKP